MGRVAVARTSWRDALASYLVAKGLALASDGTERRIVGELAAEWSAAQRERVAKRLAEAPPSRPIAR